LIFRWRINTLSLGDDEAKSLGMNVGALRGLFIFCSTLLTSAVVAIAGIVGWVGLIIPHLVRFVFGEDNRIVIPMSLVIGACFLVVVNTACNSLIASEIPLGILTSIVGAPFFFIILLKQRKGGAI
jgi:iron complex transport system permease protein